MADYLLHLARKPSDHHLRGEGIAGSNSPWTDWLQGSARAVPRRARDQAAFPAIDGSPHLNRIPLHDRTTRS